MPRTSDPQQQLMITPSEVMEYLYCPRFTYYLNVLRISQYEKNRYKVLKGRQVHEQRLRHNKSYLPKKIPVLKKEIDVYLADPGLRVRGIVDEILYLEDGTLAPVDYKFSPFKESVYKTHKVQMCLYALLIERTYGRPVIKGYIAYIRGGSKTLDVDITEGMKAHSQKIVDDVFDVILSEKLPEKTKSRVRCVDCTYKNICV